jgi:hypothetical protein
MKRLLKKIAGPILPDNALSEPAEALWNNPAFKAAIKQSVAEIQDEWLQCPDKERRELLHMENRALTRVLERIQSYYQPD